MNVCTKQGKKILQGLCSMCPYREIDMRAEGFPKPCIYEVRQVKKVVDSESEE